MGVTRFAAAVGLALAVLVPVAAAEVAEKPKPPKPRLELLTTTELGALRREAIKLAVKGKRGAKARIEARLVVDGYPDDFHFRLGPETEKLSGGDATVRFPLSARKLEVLDFAAQTCRPATVEVTVRAAGRSTALTGKLKRPSECRPG